MTEPAIFEEATVAVPDTATALERKIEERNLHLCVIGLGYVGLPVAVAFAQEGLQVTGIDIDREKIATLRAGRSYIADVPDDQVAELVSAGRLRATDNYQVLAKAHATIICVPTPLSKTRDPDISYIICAADQVAEHLQQGQLIVLESTTYPGTTQEVLLPRLARDGYRVGHEFFLAFSPERIDPGNRTYNLRNTPKVLGGSTPTCLRVASALYKLVVKELVPVSDTATAEMVKLLENTFRAVNIGLINEVALMCNRLGIDVWEVIEAASTKPYGFMPFYPGPGLGGHCIPLDPYYLAWKLRTLNYTARFIQLAGEVNASMPDHVVGLVIDALNARRKAVNGSRLLIVGVAYKPNVGDIRESPALDILQKLHAKGAQLYYYDPHVPHIRIGALTMSSSEISDALLSAMDGVVIVTPHEGIDWVRILRNASLVIDTRNATAAARAMVGEEGAEVIRL